MGSEAKFVRLTKANKSKDRLLIAIDGICTVEECREEKCTKVYTMDGFWYSVVDSIESLDKILGGVTLNRSAGNEIREEEMPYHKDEQRRGKVAFIRKRKMLPPGVEKPQERPSTSEVDGLRKENQDDERKAES